MRSKLLSTELGPAGGGYAVAPAIETAAPAGPRIVMLVASHDTQAALLSWARACGFDLTRTHGGRVISEDAFDFHITLLATADAVAIPLTDHEIDPVEVVAAGFNVLGKDGDTPVLDLEHDGLDEMREHFVSTYGATPTFADFKPHVSLSYAWAGEPMLDNLDLPDFQLVFNRLVVREFEPEAKDAADMRQRKSRFDGVDLEHIDELNALIDRVIGTGDLSEMESLQQFIFYDGIGSGEFLAAYDRLVDAIRARSSKATAVPERKGLLWDLLVGYDLTNAVTSGVVGAAFGAGAAVLTSAAVRAISSLLRGKKGVLEDALAKVSAAATQVHGSGNTGLAALLEETAAALAEEIARIEAGIAEAEDAEEEKSAAPQEGGLAALLAQLEAA